MTEKRTISEYVYNKWELWKGRDCKHVLQHGTLPHLRGVFIIFKAPDDGKLWRINPTAVDGVMVVAHEATRVYPVASVTYAATSEELPRTSKDSFDAQKNSHLLAEDILEHAQRDDVAVGTAVGYGPKQGEAHTFVGFRSGLSSAIQCCLLAVREEMAAQVPRDRRASDKAETPLYQQLQALVDECERNPKLDLAHELRIVKDGIQVLECLAHAHVSTPDTRLHHVINSLQGLDDNDFEALELTLKTLEEIW